ncbi:hypothetical protein BBOR36S_01050 [Brevibacillus borstelensis]
MHCPGSFFVPIMQIYLYDMSGWQKEKIGLAGEGNLNLMIYMVTMLSVAIVFVIWSCVLSRKYKWNRITLVPTIVTLVLLFYLLGNFLRM